MPCFSTVLTHIQSNILVDPTGHARIADFGHSAVIKDVDSAQSESNDRGHPARWTAPEVLDGSACSEQADIFSFAMVMTEVR